VSAAITYREIAPSPALAGLVRCYWQIRSADEIGRPVRNRVLPDGCADIIVNFGRPLLAADAVSRKPAEARVTPFVVGAMRAPRCSVSAAARISSASASVPAAHVRSSASRWRS
jgi:hypothetical protein